MSSYIITYDGELYHHGVKGMKWGVRKAQYQPTGTRKLRSSYKEQQEQAKMRYKQEKSKYKQTDQYKQERAKKTKKALKIGAAVAGTALATYGAYKVGKYISNQKAMKAAQKEAERILANKEKDRQMAERLYMRFTSDPSFMEGVKSYSTYGGGHEYTVKRG